MKLTYAIVSQLSYEELEAGKFKRFTTQLLEKLIDEVSVIEDKDNNDLFGLQIIQVLMNMPFENHEVKPTTAAVTKMLKILQNEQSELMYTTSIMWLTNIIPLDSKTKKTMEDGFISNKKFIGMLTSSNMNLSAAMANFYYVINNKNINQLIKCVGYGNIAGFLHNNKIPLDNCNLNSGFITGNTLPIDQTNERNTEEMTEEEKEREVDKLVTLFDRINKNGVLKIKNPLENLYN